MSKLSGWDDTIVALATAPGISAIGVIRLSGVEALSIADALFPSKDLLQQLTHTIHVGFLVADGKALDEVVVSLFRSPRSYTGEDVVEISCHGSPFIEEQIIQACVFRGARLARAGEFTQRAFLNGKLDLTQAEAVADLIASNTAASHRSALFNVRGGFSEALKNLREQLITFSALIELELDFSQEDVEFADRSQLYALVKNASEKVSSLLQSFSLGNVIRNGVQVAIVGKPNAGKSTLLNTLLNEDRAIVSDIPGTTRDTIEELINIEGILFRLVDTAGIREHTSGTIETMGIEKSLEKIRQSDLVVYLFDVNDTSLKDLQDVTARLQADGVKYVLAGNKADTADELTLRTMFEDVEGIIFISARQNQGIDLLKRKLADDVMQGVVQREDAIVTNARHYAALQQVYQTLTDIRKGLDEGLTGDLLALDIRRSLQSIGEITGEITTEDQLDYIFSKFCIGK